MENLPDGPQSPNIRAIFIVILAIGILAAAGTYAFSRNKNSNSGGGQDQQSQQDQQAQNNFNAISPNTIVYGTWQGSNAFVKSFDLETGAKTVLAQLNQDVKHVTVLDSNHLLYIDQTDQDDRGYQLMLYDIAAQQAKPVYTASSSLGIDDYVVSPNKKYIAVWEYVSGNDGLLRGGQSRVYTADLGVPDQKNEIYVEDQDGQTPVHYPRAITNTGDVYCDTFIPNDGKGWANGMSVSDFKGTNKQDVSQMQKGTYGTQPLLSPDGRYLAFGGYDKASDPHPGADDRVRAIVRPNTVELLDTQTKARTRLPNVPADYIYKSVAWDQTTGDIIYSALATAKDFSNTGMYTYSLSSKRPTKLSVGDSNSFIVTLTDGKKLVGSTNGDDPNVGNLGPRYVPPFMDFSVIDPMGKESDITMNDSMMQFIGLVGSKYFAANNGNTASVQSTKNKNDNESENEKGKDSEKEGKDKNDKKDKNNTDTGNSDSSVADSTCNGFDNLQLCPFYFKAPLARKRQHQQTDTPPDVTPPPVKTPGDSTKCDDLADQQCMDQGFDQGSDGFESCYTQWQLQNRANYMLDGTCHDSPLYLYGTQGQKVHVIINTPIYNAVPSYKNGYDITLLQDGQMAINGGTFSSISYNYTSALRKVTPPARGTVAAQKDVPTVLRNYAEKIGLNEKETNDLIAYGVQNVVSPYVFISFYDESTSEKMLPISFSPQPDNYRNVVFYFRLLQSQPPFSVQEPVFPAVINRTGFTAIEISGVVE